MDIEYSSEFDDVGWVSLAGKTRSIAQQEQDRHVSPSRSGLLQEVAYLIDILGNPQTNQEPIGSECLRLSTWKLVGRLRMNLFRRLDAVSSNSGSLCVVWLLICVWNRLFPGLAFLKSSYRPNGRRLC